MFSLDVCNEAIHTVVRLTPVRAKATDQTRPTVRQQLGDVSGDLFLQDTKQLKGWLDKIVALYTCRGAGCTGCLFVNQSSSIGC